MFAAAVVASLATSLHMFTYDRSPTLLAMLLAARYFPGRRHRTLQIVLAAALLMLWMPPLFFLLLARHWFYLFFPVLMLLLFGIFKLAVIPPEAPAIENDDARVRLADL